MSKLELVLAWKVASIGKSPKIAAEDYAMKAFDKPRKITWLGDNRFALEDGAYAYRVVFCSDSNSWGIHPRYEIWQERIISRTKSGYSMSSNTR